MKIFFWTDTALNNYHENIDYLLRDWTEKKALNFIDDVERVLFNLKKGTLEFKESNYKGIRECVVCKQMTLFYRHIDNNKIEFLCF
jgi:plasmid stabilization system protein ParE